MVIPFDFLDTAVRRSTKEEGRRNYVAVGVYFLWWSVLVAKFWRTEEKEGKVT